MKNIMLSCKQLKILAVFLLLVFLIIDFFIIKTSVAISVETLFEIVVIIFIVLYFYCKKTKKQEK